MTHGSFATLDNERNLPTLPGRKNRDLSIYNFDRGGGKFYTVFPYFHLAGFLSIVFNPLFTNASSPVLGPALMPPSGDLLKQVMTHQKLRALYVPPSLPEQMLHEPDGLELFRQLDFLCYTGGPFSQKAGETLSEVTELIPLYGCTETFQVPQVRPKDPKKDFAYMEWNPCCKLEMESSDDEAGTYEMIMYADDSNKDTCALHYNKPGIPEWRTRDLFKKHHDPSKTNLWMYYGRRDDIVVLSNGEKFNPVPMELIIQGHPLLAGALVHGLGRKQAALIVEPKVDVQERDSVTEQIWPHVEKANLHVPGQGRIVRSKILVASADKPFTRAGKGTVVRKLTEKSYSKEIDHLYLADNNKSQSSKSLKPMLVPSFPLLSVNNFVQEAVMYSLPSAPGLSETDDFYAHGLDSLKTTELCETLKDGLQGFTKSSDLSWISTRFIYEHATVDQLSKVLHEFLNTGNAPNVNSKHGTAFQAVEADAMVEDFSANLSPKQTKTNGIGSNELCVALTGSTGSLGTELLHNLLTGTKVSKIYCLNRTSDAEARQTQTLTSRFGTTAQDLAKITYLTVDLSKPQLDLPNEKYTHLLATITTIIHNAWKLDFNLPLRSFTPHIRGIRNLIDWSIHSPRSPHIMFTSSVSCILNQPPTPSTPIPESPAHDSTSTLPIGYAQSKYVAERILTLANSTAGVPISILRAGQIGGSARPGDVAAPRQEWLMSLLSTSKIMDKIPSDFSPIDWIPIDSLARTITDILHSPLPSTPSLKVYNLVNPHPVPWSMLLTTLSSRFNITPKPVPLPEWVKEVAAQKTSAGPAGQLLGFYEALGGGKTVSFETASSREASETFASIGAVDEALMERWLREWGL